MEFRRKRSDLFPMLIWIVSVSMTKGDRAARTIVACVVSAKAFRSDQSGNVFLPRRSRAKCFS
jgi:hypothetical protein